MQIIRSICMYLLIILLLSPLPSTSTAVQVLYDEPTGRLALVFELMVTISAFLRVYRLKSRAFNHGRQRNAEDMNLYEAIKGRRHYLPEQKV